MRFFLCKKKLTTETQSAQRIRKGKSPAFDFLCDLCVSVVNPCQNDEKKYS